MSNLTVKRPFEYFIDNYCGKNTEDDSCKDTATKDEIFDTYFSHIPLKMSYDDYIANDRGFYFSKMINNMLLIKTDGRSFINKEQKSIFGQKQKQFILDSINNAYTNSTIQSILIYFNHPWQYNKTRYDKDWIKQGHISLDDAFVEEKQEIASALEKFNFNNPNTTNFKSVLMLTSQGYLSFDDGSNNNFGGFPVLSCGAMSEKGHCTGGPFSHGFADGFTNQYCLLEVYNQADKQCLKIQGFYAKYKDKDENNFVTYNTCEPHLYHTGRSIKCQILWTEKLANVFVVIGVNIVFILFFFVFLKKLAEKNFSYQKLE